MINLALDFIAMLNVAPEYIVIISKQLYTILEMIKIIKWCAVVLFSYLHLHLI